MGTNPCIIGVAQETVRGGRSPEPLDLWEGVSRRAADDANAKSGSVLGAVDSLQIVYCQSWQYDDPAGRLVQRLGNDPRHRLYSGIGGTTPQMLVQDAAESIVRGDYDCALITGAEALETRRQAGKRGERLAWSHKDPERKPFPFEAPFHAAELAHDMLPAWLTFALWDIARRAHLGVAPEEYRLMLGQMMAPMTDVAEANPYAWFRRSLSVDELLTPTPENRMVGYPYTKYMVSVMDVDMSAAVIVASEEKADELGVPEDRRVRLRGWCYATDPVYVAEHEPMWESPAMRAAGAEAFRCAGLGVDDAQHLDLYSCFGSSLTFARDSLGIADADPRPLTVTGGLPFAGGAGSNYMTHSIATMTDVLRMDPGSVGLVSGVGMHMTKHVFGVYSTTPGCKGAPDHAGIQTALDRRPKKAIRDSYAGPATIATYSVVHSRDLEPEWALLVCDLPGSDRCYARAEGPDLLAAMESEEWVGRQVTLTTSGGVNRVDA